MLELEHGFRVVDVHARLEPEDGEHPGESLSTPERLEREMHQAGIVRSVVFPGTQPKGYLRVNNAVARMSVGRPFVPAARINGSRDPGASPSAKLRNLTASREDHHTSPEDVEQYAYDDRFVAFKLHPPADGLPDEAVLEQLEQVGLPVVVHGGADFPPAALEAHVLEYDFPTVVSHFGGYPLHREYMHETIDLLDSYDSCYVDTSLVRFRDLLERAIIEHPDRVCFGSGSPACHPDVPIMEILTLDIPQDAMRKVFSKNPGRVFDALAP
ncbi:amidohydrolase family protein [Haloarculaceae archaeon H-GB1-1]|nr:amidohydrolase family protein [Haloarculaceae archaeon H-GB1-1]